MLYSVMAIKQTFGGRSQKITPEFIFAAKLKILVVKIENMTKNPVNKD